MMAIERKQLNSGERVSISEDGAVRRQNVIRGLSRRQMALLASAGLDRPYERWAIIKVANRRDNDVDKSLASALIDRWLPLTKADQPHHGGRTGTKGEPKWVLAWPGYVFVKMADTAEDWHRIRKIKHTVSVLGVDERPVFIDDDMMLKIKAELACLKPVRRNAGMLFEAGEIVRVSEGVFAGQNAIVSSADDDERAKVEITLFGRVVPIELSLANLEKC